MFERVVLEANVVKLNLIEFTLISAILFFEQKVTVYYYP